MPRTNTESNYIKELKSAFNKGQLTVYVGAGVSQASGLPSWQKLVLSMYFRTLNEESFITELRPFPNYLYAIAEWQLKKRDEPLDVVIRKLKVFYRDNNLAFLNNLKENLYASFGNMNLSNANAHKKMLDKNKTLQAIINLCKKSKASKKGVCGIVTYNYDNLLEMAIADPERFESIWKSDAMVNTGKIPIYHVHGYIPYTTGNTGSQHPPDDVILSEEQYNYISQDAYYWGNFIQMKHLSNTTGLMIGLSLTDRNLRRILDAVKKMPLKTNNYIVFQKPNYTVPTVASDDIKTIMQNSVTYLNKFIDGGIKKESKAPDKIQQLIRAIYEYDEIEFKKGFEDLGLKVILINSYETNEILNLFNKIAAPVR